MYIKTMRVQVFKMLYRHASNDRSKHDVRPAELGQCSALIFNKVPLELGRHSVSGHGITSRCRVLLCDAFCLKTHSASEGLERDPHSESCWCIFVQGSIKESWSYPIQKQ